MLENATVGGKIVCDFPLSEKRSNVFLIPRNVNETIESLGPKMSCFGVIGRFSSKTNSLL